MSNTNPFTGYQNADDVEPVDLEGLAVTVDPDVGGLRQLLLLAPGDRGYRSAERIALTGFDFDESHHPVPLDHQVDVAATVPEPAIDDQPPVPAEPPLSDSLTQLPKCLSGRGHGANVNPSIDRTTTKNPRSGSNIETRYIAENPR